MKFHKDCRLSGYSVDLAASSYDEFENWDLSDVPDEYRSIAKL